MNYNPSSSFYFLVIVFTLLTYVLALLIFQDSAAPDIFFIKGFLVVAFTLCLYYFLYSNVLYIKEFVYKIFLISLIVRLFYLLVYHNLFYTITGTPFEVTYADSVWYHSMGERIAEQLRSRNFDFNWLILQRGLDGFGYNFFLGCIYYLSNDSIITARIIQTIISAHTVVLAYKIGSKAGTEEQGRSVAILYAGFPTFLLYTTLHLREFLMIYILLVYINSLINIIQDKYLIRNILVLTLAVLSMLFLRTAIVVVMLAGTAIYYLFNYLRSRPKKQWLIIVFLGVILVLVLSTPFFDTATNKLLGYIGLGTGDARLGGRSQEQILRYGQDLGKFVFSSIVFLIPTILLPIPTTITRPVENFGLNMQYFELGGITIWFTLAFFAIRGMYYSFKNKEEILFLLLIFALLYQYVILESFIFTSFRFSQPKMALVLFFVPLGFKTTKKTPQILFICFFASILILVWNYIR